MRDEETGSYWQQITGTAIAGPLKGRELTLVPQDELTFALWKKEQPNGTVLAPLGTAATLNTPQLSAEIYDPFAIVPVELSGLKFD